jgi:hypothetical protein
LKVENIFLWDDKIARVRHETMVLDITEGGKQILNIPARNEVIDLWNLQSYLKQGPGRASWCYFYYYFLLINFLERSYLNIRAGQIMNPFLQCINIPISSKTAPPEDVKRMVLAVRKYDLKFAALSISTDIKLNLPIWKHPATHKEHYKHACLRDAATYLRLNHGVQIVRDALTIANPRTVIIRKPHMVNPSGSRRKNCGSGGFHCGSFMLSPVEWQHPFVSTGNEVINDCGCRIS